MTVLTVFQSQAVIATLSPIRMSTYQAAVSMNGGDVLKLYEWNAKISSAFLQSLQVCEVSMRNGIAGAIERQYGKNWPWNPAFEMILTEKPGIRFRTELDRARRNFIPGQTGKVIAELKFSFWCHMLTSRHDKRIWIPYLRNEFPNPPTPLLVKRCRAQMHEAMEKLRTLRNRAAHHEPIFAYPLDEHFEYIKDLIDWRCRETASWHSQWESISATLLARP